MVRSAVSTLRSALQIRSARTTSNDWIPTDWIRARSRLVSRRSIQRQNQSSVTTAIASTAVAPRALRALVFSAPADRAVR